MKKRNKLSDVLMQLDQAVAECARLREENAQLKRLLAGYQDKNHDKSVQKTTTQVAPLLLPSTQIISNQLSPETKISLFRSLFRGRDDVYALRWEGKGGKTGYSPACARPWNRYSFEMTKSPYTDPQREFFPLTDDVIREHLQGKYTAGIYPLLLDETCWFLAVDFDKKTWMEDVTAFMQTCREMAIPAALERSRSGNGAHVWIFFEGNVPAALARKLGCLILTRTMERRHQLGLDSYDRLFPNQDTMPKGGFGNLIALPLQRHCRDQGNSVFIDDYFQPFPDQWLFLSQLQRLSLSMLEKVVAEASWHDEIVGVRRIADEDDDEPPWTMPPSGCRLIKPITEPLPDMVRIIKANLLYIEKKELPSIFINRLIRIAAFQNPEFYKAQAMRLSTFGKPRIISCAEEFSQYIGLPRGCLEEVLELLTAHNIKPEIVDELYMGSPLPATFRGELRPMQQMAAAAMLPYEDGILSAPTAFGKTAVAAYLIAERKVNTLILVHRRHLLDQWLERLTAFLSVTAESIGQIGGGKTKMSGQIDVGIIQSLNRKGWFQIE